eukprot:2928828-Prymnesium_polylepis.2
MRVSVIFSLQVGDTAPETCGNGATSELERSHEERGAPSRVGGCALSWTVYEDALWIVQGIGCRAL